MAKVSISVNLNPETEEEQKIPSLYQNIAYTLNGLKPSTKLDDLGEMIYEWLKKQKK